MYDKNANDVFTEVPARPGQLGSWAPKIFENIFKLFDLWDKFFKPSKKNFNFGLCKIKSKTKTRTKISLHFQHLRLRGGQFLLPPFNLFHVVSKRCQFPKDILSIRRATTIHGLLLLFAFRFSFLVIIAKFRINV